MNEWFEFNDLVENVQNLLDLGLYDNAIEMLDKFEAIYNAQWEIPYLYSRVYLEQDLPEQAKPFIERCLEIDSTNLDSLLGMFYCYAQMNQTAQGGPYLLRAEKIAPENIQVLNALIWYKTEMSEYREAIDIFIQVQKRGEENVDSFRNAGIAYQRLGENNKAEYCFIKAFELNPSDEEREMLADHFILTGKLDSSINLYREELKQAPKNIRILSRLTFCFSQNEQFEDAEACARRTIELYPNSTTGYIDLAYIHLNNGRNDTALEMAEKALSVSPIDAEAYRAKAIALAEKEQVSAANKAFEKAIAIDPENPEIKRDYYHHLRNTGKIEKMMDLAYEVIKQESPYCVEDYWFLANYYREQGQSLKSFQFLHKAYKCMPGDKELLPPMIDILLDENHVEFSARFLLDYASRSGWNNTMNAFTRHRRLQGKMAQESLRFLRFYSEKGESFNSYIFYVYLNKIIPASVIVLFPVFTALFFTLIGRWGIVIGIVLFAILYIIVRYLMNRYTIREIEKPKGKRKERKFNKTMNF